MKLTLPTAIIITIINTLVLYYLHSSFSAQYLSKILELSKSSQCSHPSSTTNSMMRQLKDSLHQEVNFQSIIRPHVASKTVFPYASEYPRAIHKHKEYAEQLKRREKLSSEGIFTMLPTSQSVHEDIVESTSISHESIMSSSSLSLRIQEYMIQMKKQFPQQFRPKTVASFSPSTSLDISNYSSSDHVYFEPMWDISVTCPKFVETSLTRSFPHDHSKNLGVYMTLVGFDGKTFVVDDQVGEPFDFRKILSNWREHLIRENPYPMIIFHYGNIPQTLKEQIRMDFHTITSNSLLFTIQFHSIHNDGSFNVKTWEKVKNRFYLHDLYKMPLLREYKYLIKLDPQLVFIKPLQYDPFRFMQDNHLLVGYSQLGLPDAAGKSFRKNMPYQTLYEYIRLYTLQQGVLPLGEMREEGNFGTHDTMHTGPFEVVHLSVYNNAYYEHYLKFIDAFRGVEEERWSEQNVRTQWIKLYVSRMATHWFCDLFTHFKIYFVPRCFVRCI